MNTNEEYYPGEWTLSIENIKRIFSGKGSLRTSFAIVWFGGSLVTLIFCAFFIEYIASEKTLKVLAVYQFVACIAVLRCAKNTPSKKWSIITPLVVILTLIFNIQSAYHLV